MKITTRYFQKAILFLLFIAVCQYSNAQDIIPDSSLKKQVKDIDQPLQKLTQLQPVAFVYNKEKFSYLPFTTDLQYGFLSEDIQSVFPELVTGKTYQYAWGKNNFKTATINQVDTQKMIPVLVAAIIEQQKQIELLTYEIMNLKKKQSK